MTDTVRAYEVVVNTTLDVGDNVTVPEYDPARKEVVFGFAQNSCYSQEPECLRGVLGCIWQL